MSCWLIWLSTSGVDTSGLRRSARLREVRREDVARGVQVLLVDHLRDRVDVARADGDADGAGAGSGLLGRRTVLPPRRQDRALVRDLVLPGQGLELVDQLEVGDERTVLDVQGKSSALHGDGLL